MIAVDIIEFEDFRPLDFLVLAKEINEKQVNFKSPNSAIKRNILGRIYYSVFLFLRDWLLKHTSYNSNPIKEHSKIPRYIELHGPFDVEVNKYISKSFKTLKKLRHQSDYYLHIPPLYSYEYSNWVFKDINYAFSLANDIISEFEKLC